MKKINWVVVGLFLLIALLAFQVGAGMMGGWTYGGWGGWGMMGPGMMGGAFFMWLWPLAFLVLLVLGVKWIADSTSRGQPGTGGGRTCPNCGQPVQAGWKHCANCGTALVN